MKKVFFCILFCIPVFTFAQTETAAAEEPAEAVSGGTSGAETENPQTPAVPAEDAEADAAGGLHTDPETASSESGETAAGKLPEERQRELRSVVRQSDNIVYQGEMFIRFALGMSVPLFSHFFKNPDIGRNGYTNNAKLYGVPVGGSAAVDFMYYLEGNWGVGIELALQILQTQANYQSLVAVGARGQYMIRRWPFDIPLSVGLGVAFNSLYIEDTESLLYAGLYIKPDFGFFYNINEKWSVGFNTTFWVVSEFYFSDEKKNQSNFSAFWDITLSARYRF